MFWVMQERDDRDDPAPPPTWPSVVAVVPARNEADVIARTVGSLLAQDYPGPFRIVLVDDQSTDGTAEARARSAPAGSTDSDQRRAASGGLDRQSCGPCGRASRQRERRTICGSPTPTSRTRRTISRRLVARAESGKLVLTSLMAKLHCESWPERYLIPAFVFFFRHALSVRLGERSQEQDSAPRRAAACWCGATRSSARATSTPSARRSSTTARSAAR